MNLSEQTNLFFRGMSLGFLTFWIIDDPDWMVIFGFSLTLTLNILWFMKSKSLQESGEQQ